MYLSSSGIVQSNSDIDVSIRVRIDREHLTTSDSGARQSYFPIIQSYCSNQVFGKCPVWSKSPVYVCHECNGWEQIRI